MGEFFKGWRRKTGIVTLVMALLSGSLWMRSYRWGEYIACPVARIDSEEGSISFSRSNGELVWGTFAVSPGRGLSKHFDIESPYSCITTPLIFLSAYLLLVKPRPKKPTEST